MNTTYGQYRENQMNCSKKDNPVNTVATPRRNSLPGYLNLYKQLAEPILQEVRGQKTQKTIVVRRQSLFTLLTGVFVLFVFLSSSFAIPSALAIQPFHNGIDLDQKEEASSGIVVQFVEPPVLANATIASYVKGVGQAKRIERAKGTKIAFRENQAIEKNISDKRAQIETGHEEFLSGVEKLVSKDKKKIANSYRLKNTANAVVFPKIDFVKDHALVNEIKKMKGVKSVISRPVHHIELNESVPLIQAPQVWSHDKFGNLCADSGKECLTGEGVVVGVIDTGVDYTHTDLGGCFGPNCKVIDGYDFQNRDNDPKDDNGHGTHVAATIAGNGTAEDGTALKGVAPGAKIVAYKVCDATGSCAYLDEAVERAMDPDQDGDFSDHLDVIGISMGRKCGGCGSGTCGGYSLDCGPDDYTSTLIDTATGAGIVASISAGNSGSGQGTIGSPGTSREAITVAASDKTDHIADFSSRGPIELLYSGEIVSKPDITAPGVLICAARADQTSMSSNTCHDSQHIAASGTSMAQPHVAGAAALLIQQHPEWLPPQIKLGLMRSSFNIGYQDYEQGEGRADSWEAFNLIGSPLTNVALFTQGKLYDYVDILGSVPQDNFSHFTLEISREDSANNWTLLADSYNYPIDYTLLPNWDTNPLPDGKYTLKLVFHTADGNSFFDNNSISIDNLDIFTEGEVSGGLDVLGRVPRGFSYKLEIGQGTSPTNWMVIVDENTYPQDNILNPGGFDTVYLADGNYQLRLTAYNGLSTFGIDTSNVYINNNAIKTPVTGLSWFQNNTTVDITGSSISAPFSYYTVSIGYGENPSGYSTAGITLENGGQQPVNNGLLAKLNTTLLTQSGFYKIRLQTYGATGLLGDDASVIYVDKEQLPGWPVTVGVKHLVGSPRIADLDHDGSKEVIVMSGDNYLYVINADGSVRPGWPVYNLDARAATPAIADLDKDGYEEIVVPNGPRMNNSTMVQDSSMYVYRHDGTVMTGWPQPVQSYWSVSKEEWGGLNAEVSHTSPAVGDIDRDGNLEIVFVTNLGNDSGPYGGTPLNLKIYAWRFDGTLMPNFPLDFTPNGYCYSITGGEPIRCFLNVSSAGLVDLNRDGFLELVVGYQHPVSDADHINKRILAIFNHDGTPFSGWPNELSGGVSVFKAESVTSDIDHDGQIEIVTNEDAGMCSPEGGCAGKIQYWGSNGTVIDSIFPDLNGPEVLDSMVVADLNNDNEPEIIVNSSGNLLAALALNGTLMPGWPSSGLSIGPNDPYPPYMIPQPVHSVVADLDGDGSQDIVQGVNWYVKTSLARIYAFHANGSEVAGFPKAVQRPINDLANALTATPAVDDLDGDGDLDLVVAGPDGRVYAFDLGAPNDPNAASPTYRHDNFNTLHFAALTHLSCVDMSCVEASGVGADYCSTDQSCMNPTHMACVNLACVEVEGLGTNECAVDDSCSYLGCQDFQCIPLAGNRPDECAIHSDCYHYGCTEDEQCALLPSGGGQECSTNQDCHFDFKMSDREGDVSNIPSLEEHQDSLDIKYVGVNRSGSMNYRVTFIVKNFTLSPDHRNYKFTFLDSSGLETIVVTPYDNVYCNSSACSSATKVGSRIAFTVHRAAPSPGAHVVGSTFLAECSNSDWADSVGGIITNPWCQTNSDCDDSLFCNGTEQCINGSCHEGTAPNCNDDIACTSDDCNESQDRCEHTPNHVFCSDGLFCDGDEQCVDGTCQAGAAPCGAGDTCNEENDLCSSDEPLDFQMNDPLDDVSIDIPSSMKNSTDIQYVGLTYGANNYKVVFRIKGDQGQLTLPPVNQYVGYGVFVNQQLAGVARLLPYGNLQCNYCSNPSLSGNTVTFIINEPPPAAGTVVEGRTIWWSGSYQRYADTVSGTIPSGSECQNDSQCSDDNVCTDDLCQSGHCVHNSNTAACNDNLYCNGTDTCSGGSCSQHAGNPCPDGQQCNEQADQCVGCSSDSDCSDSLYCNGAEQCVSGTCQAGAVPNCSDNIACTADSCNESLDKCDHAPNDALCSDDQFCNGSETCNTASGCQEGTNPCPDGQQCNELADQCLPSGSYNFQITDPESDVNAGIPQELKNSLDIQMVGLTYQSNSYRVAFDVTGDNDSIRLPGDGEVFRYAYVARAAVSEPSVIAFIRLHPNGSVDCLPASYCSNPIKEGTILSATINRPAPAAGSNIDVYTAWVVGNTAKRADAAAGTIPGQPGCQSNADCDDRNVCTNDTCTDGQCTHSPNTASCGDGLFCNGEEICANGTCQPGTPINCGDSVSCTVDSCNESLDRCEHAANDNVCSNHQFCDGEETCHPTKGCLSGRPPCTENQTCNETINKCLTSICLVDANCQDTLFCNGEETCVSGSCEPGVNPCSDGEICDEEADQCVSSNSSDFQMNDPTDDVNASMPVSLRNSVDIESVSLDYETGQYRVTFDLKGDNGRLTLPQEGYLRYIFSKSTWQGYVYLYPNGSLTCNPQYYCVNPEISGTQISFTVKRSPPAPGTAVSGHAGLVVGSTGYSGDVVYGTTSS